MGEFQAVEVRSAVKTVATVRALLMKLAYRLAKDDVTSGTLILNEPVVTDDRLDGEWTAVTEVIRKHLLDRLAIYAVRGRHITGWPEDPNPATEQWIRSAVGPEIRSPGSELPRTDYFTVIFKILLNQFFRSAEPVTSKWLQQTAGCTYPTAAKALDRLEHRLYRTKDRRIRLRSFPEEEWSALVLQTTTGGQVRRFSDASGQPRAINHLVKRLAALERTDVAIGGTLAGRHFLAVLDLVGDPRLDLAVHAPEGTLDLSFIDALDPALEPVGKEHQHCAVAVHPVRAAEPQFEVGEKLHWASPVDTLLHLHDMRLESQASQLLGFLRDRARQLNG